MYHMARCKKVRAQDSSVAASEETDLVLSSFRQVHLARTHTCKTSSAYVYPLERPFVLGSLRKQSFI
jgi:hypothetical protein